jgi:pimeloyl-ACP methyl ester carboxylesterase
MDKFKAAFNSVWLLLAIVPTLCGNAQAVDTAEEWRASGSYFTWRSTLPENQGKTVQVFYTCMGDAAKPVIVMLHGFPTSSFDFRALIPLLQPDYRICTLDFPGYGVSDKPAASYRYSLGEDAQLVWDFVTTVVPLKEFSLFSHDRADSVALNFLQLYQAVPNPPFRITHQFLTNANMYLPLANLTDFQKAMLGPDSSAAAVKSITPERLAVGLGLTQYSPPLKPDDPEVRALAFNFAWQDGIPVIPATIQYLNERMKFEVGFLETLSRSSVPATLIWGVHDTVSPVRVANYVWDTALKPRDATASYWLVPCANHYLAHDQPQDIARIMRLALANESPSTPQNLTTEICAPVLVDRH